MPKNSQANQQKLEIALKKINSIYEEFKKELAILKAERMEIVKKINKKSEDKKIQEILKKIR